MTEQVHKLGEVLRAAREAKGVDLDRVERETKIRERYLSALESGDYAELPGSVYTKGFLRNYGAYLGLDAEYLIDLYRLETAGAAAERQRVPAPPRPLATRRARAFVVTPGAIVGAILTLLVGAFIAVIVYELINFARMPELRITEPAGDVRSHDELTYTVRGVTAPNARITVSGLRENPTITADDDGAFEVTVELVPGSNVIQLTAFDPVTSRDSEVVERTIRVVTDVAGSPSPGTVALTIEQPAADATIVGAVPIAGSAAPGETVTVTASAVAAPTPTFSVVDGTGAAVPVTPAVPGAPEPLALTAAADGALSGSLALAAAVWDVTFTPAAGEAVTRRLTVGAGEGLSGRLRIGGDSYLEVEQDGTPVAGVSGAISNAGEEVQLRATREIRVRAGNAAAVRVSMNGISIGPMGGAGAVVEWRITRIGG